LNGQARRARRLLLAEGAIIELDTRRDPSLKLFLSILLGASAVDGSRRKHRLRNIMLGARLLETMAPKKILTSRRK
jgi:hypothetical protein